MDTEETPLLPQPEPSPTLYYSKKAYLIAKHPFSVFLAAGSILVLICWMLDGMGYPAPQNLDSSLVLDGEAASGLYAWDIVKNITTEPHSWNTDTNLAVKAFLSHEIYRLEQEYMSWNCPFANPFKISTVDPLNVILNKDNAVYYFESSNILVGLGPDANGTLLISSHYDSAVLSHGVTDDGIATGAMMSVISALSNYACHNLLQFRVLFLFNNAEEVNLLGSLAFTKDKQFDSVSAFLNFDGTGVSRNGKAVLFRSNSQGLTSKVLQSASSPHAKSIGSFLDAVLEMIGSDTDYSNYFKQKPGLDYAFYSDRYLYHTAKDDLQHSSLYSAQFLCDTMYDAIKGMHPKSLSTFVKSPVVFYSIFSLSYVSVSKTWYMVSYALLVTVVGLSCFGSYLFTRRNDEETARSHLLESIWAFSIVCLAFLASILFSVAVGGIKTYLNHGSSYGYPEIGLVTTCLQTFAICIIIDLLIKRSRARDVARDPESDVAAVQKDYTMVGNFLFFTLSSITAIFCGFFGIDIVYLPLYWTIFSGVSLVGTLGMSQLAPQVAESVPELFSLIPIFGTLVLPFSLTFDMIHMLLISLPSTIGDGIPDYVCDTIWVPLIFPIATVSTVIKRPKYLLLGLMAAWAILYTTSLALFPFTGERPFKYSYSEVWDVTTRASSQYTTVAVVTMAHISGLKWVNQIWDPRSPFYNQTVSDQSNNHFEFKSSNLPVFNRTVDTDTLIGLSIQYGPEVSTFRLTLTAPVESRMLKLEWAHTSPDFAIWLDPDHYSRWTNQSKPGSTSTFDPSIPMYIMRRSHQEKTMIHVRATDPFLLTVTAYMDLKLSTNWPLQTPEWSIPCRTTDGGGLGIVRQFSVG